MPCRASSTRSRSSRASTSSRRAPPTEHGQEDQGLTIQSSPRARDLGIAIGEGTPGPSNAITDVAGVRVGHTTLIEGEGPLVVGRGPIRTGVTVVVPHDGDVWAEPLFAGTATLNGNGELTGLEWIRESGLLTGAIGITNTNDVGKVRDALTMSASAAHDAGA